jgi:ACS family hexuronate transporter-like MFS transporter
MVFRHSRPNRWWILTLLVLSLVVNLVDRQVLSVVAPLIRDELHLSNTQYSYILLSFLLGMTLFQAPMGILLDRWGVRLGIPALMLFWSAANAATSVARSVFAFCGFRFLLGAGECGNYSGGIKAIARLFPPEEQALAGGMFDGGTLIGAFIAPPFITAICLHFGWRAAFLLPSALGLFWIVPWLMFYHPGEAAADDALEQPSLKSLLRVRELWGMSLVRMLGGPVIHFYWYWLPEYLHRVRHLSMKEIGPAASVPFLFAGLGNVVGGWFSGWLMAKGWTADRARKLTFLIGAGLCGASMAAPGASTQWLALAMISLATFGISMYASTYIGAVTDLFSEKVLARVNGVTGAVEDVVNMIFMLVTGIVVDRVGYSPVFLAAGLMPLLGYLAMVVVVRRIRPVI